MSAVAVRIRHRADPVRQARLAAHRATTHQPGRGDDYVHRSKPTTPHFFEQVAIRWGRELSGYDDVGPTEYLERARKAGAS